MSACKHELPSRWRPPLTPESLIVLVGSVGSTAPSRSQTTPRLTPCWRAPVALLWTTAGSGAPIARLWLEDTLPPAWSYSPVHRPCHRRPFPVICTSKAPCCSLSFFWQYARSELSCLLFPPFWLK